MKVLVLSGGHPFDRGAFTTFVEALDVDWEHVEQPEAQARLRPGAVKADVVLAYDMPGIVFRSGELPILVEPSPAVVEGYEALLAAGQPFVFLHHAICSWPAWPGFADIVGGRYHYVPAELRGSSWPDSGYRHEVRQTFTVVAPEHPVCTGLPREFTLTDETYLCPIFEDEVTPLVVTDASRTERDHWSTVLAVTGRRDENEGWHHPPGSPFAAWAKRSGRSPVVYIQPGDGPGAMGDAYYRRLVANALRWVASPAARAWAAEGAPG